jgi:hypothetical protein
MGNRVYSAGVLTNMVAAYARGRIDGAIKLTKNNTMKTTNSIFAIQAAVPAMPLKPSANAINATTRNVSAQPNMTILLVLCLEWGVEPIPSTFGAAPFLRYGST